MREIIKKLDPRGIQPQHSTSSPVVPGANSAPITPSERPAKWRVAFLLDVADHVESTASSLLFLGAVAAWNITQPNFHLRLYIGITAWLIKTDHDNIIIRLCHEFTRR
jgi:hypothetical protein